MCGEIMRVCIYGVYIWCGREGCPSVFDMRERVA